MEYILNETLFGRLENVISIAYEKEKEEAGWVRNFFKPEGPDYPKLISCLVWVFTALSVVENYLEFNKLPKLPRAATARQATLKSKISYLLTKLIGSRNVTLIENMKSTTYFDFEQFPVNVID